MDIPKLYANYKNEIIGTLIALIIVITIYTVFIYESEFSMLFRLVDKSIYVGPGS